MAPEPRDNDEYYKWDERLKESMDLLQASWKRLPKYGKKVRQKREKEKAQRSKHIEKWRGLYNEKVNDMSKNIKNIIEIYNTLPKSPTDEPDDGGFRRGTKFASSLPPKRRRSDTGNKEAKADPEMRQLKRMRQENDDLNLNRQLQEYQNSLSQRAIDAEAVKEQFAREEEDLKRQLQETIDKLRQHAIDAEAVKEQFARNEEDLKRQLQDAIDKAELQKRTIEQAKKDREELDQCKNRIQHLYNDISDVEAERRKLAQNEEVLKRNLQKAEDRIDTLNVTIEKEKKEKNGALRRIDTLNATIEKEKKEKDDALRRLSALVSSRIRDNNINIVDLSDENRPTKLSENLSEIYDNEWTDCFDQLGDDDSKEPEFIRTLLDILMKIYNTCLKWSTENFFESVQRAIDRTYVESEAESMDTSTGELLLPKDLQQPIKDFKKLRGPKVLPTIQKLVRKKMPKLFEGPYSTEVFQKYIKKCTEFSWLAVVQDPPLALNADPVEEFNTKLFREYMKRGPYVEFVVWPALHIKEGGPLLMKGVAQGAKEKYGRDGKIETSF